MATQWKAKPSPELKSAAWIDVPPSVQYFPWRKCPSRNVEVFATFRAFAIAYEVRHRISMSMVCKTNDWAGHTHASYQ